MSMNGPWDENWEVLEKGFGKGGQGMAHRVRDKRDPEKQAILKVLKNNKSLQARGRMYREVASLTTIHAAGGKVPDVLEHNTQKFEDDKVQLYLVMRLVPGRTLEQVVQECGALSLEQSIEIARGISATVQIGHNADVLHRDLKPQNILVDEQNWRDVTILDYGLSFNAGGEEEELTRMSENFANTFLDLPETNTPGGDRRDKRSDITAICGVLYYCLTGHRPGQLRDGNNHPPHKRPKYSVRERLTGDNRATLLDALFDRAFSTALESRIQTVQELLDRLDAVLAAPSGAPLSPVEVAKRATELLTSGADRKTVLADFAEAAQGIAGAVQDHVQQLHNKMSKGSIQLTVQRRPEFEMPDGVDRVAAHPVFAFVGVRHHNDQRVIAYGFCARGNRCCVLRRLGIQEPPRGPDLEKEQEVASFERGEAPDVSAIIEDLDQTINGAIDFMARRIVGQGVLK
jgi:serine/threonine protein kinase